MRTKVVVIGGGYGGLRAIEFLAKHNDVDITLIDKNPYHYLQAKRYDENIILKSLTDFFTFTTQSLLNQSFV